MSYTDIFGGSTVQPSQVSYTTLTLNAPQTMLTWPTEFLDNINVVSRIIDVTPTGINQELIMPSALLVSVGQDVLITNPGIFDFDLLKNDNTLLSTIEAGKSMYFYLINNTTVGGQWRTIPFAEGVSVVTSVDADVPNATDAANMAIVGGPITAAGTLHFAFTGDINELINFGAATGIAVRTGVEAWELKSITPVPNGNVIVNNIDGSMLGNITIDLVQDIGVPPNNPITSIRVGNISISGNLIESSNVNGDINIAPNGTGSTIFDGNVKLGFGASTIYYNNDNTHFISFSGANIPPGGPGFDTTLFWPSVAPVSGQVLQIITPNTLQWATVPTFTDPLSTDNAIARFNGTGGQLQNSVVLIDDIGNLTSPSSLIATNSLITGTLVLTSANVISTLAGSIVLDPFAGSFVQSNSNLVLGTNAANRSLLYQSGLFQLSLSAPVLAANVALTYPSTVGAANALIQSNGFGVLSFTDIAGGTGTSGLVATQAQVIAESGATAPVISSRIRLSPGVAKARGIFVGATGVVQSSYNVTGNANRTGVGNYTITFTTAFAAADYSVVATAELTGGNPVIVVYGARTANTVVIRCFNAAAAAIDPTTFSFSAHGTQ